MREFINSKIVDNKGRRTNLKTEVARNQSNQFSRKTKKRGGDCSSSGEFDVLSFLVTSILKFTLLPYYQRNNGYTRFKIFPGANPKELFK